MADVHSLFAGDTKARRRRDGLVRGHTPVSYQRVQNVLYHAPKSIRGTERLALVVVADGTPGPGNDDRAWSIGRDEFAQAIAVQPKQVRQVLARLAEQGADIRVAVAKDKDGEPVYAHRGSVATYRVPWFDAPDGCLCEPCRKGAVSAAPFEAEKEPSSRPLTPDKGAVIAAPNPRKGPSQRPKGAVTTAPSPVPDKPPANLDARAAAEDDPTATPEQPPAGPPKLAEPAQLIADTLADEHVTPDEAQAIMRAFTASHSPRGIGLYRKIAQEGGIAWRAHLADLRAKARAAIGDEIAKRAAHPPCIHGEPGGDKPHPDTGKAYCPLCRRGIPAPVDQPSPVETYRRIYLAARHAKPPLNLMEAVGRQAADLAARGGSPPQLQAAAAAAAINGTDLVTHLRTERGHASA